MTERHRIEHTSIMKITLLNTGLEIEVPIGAEKKGRDRVIEALERRNAGRLPGDLRPLSATDSGAQVGTSASAEGNPDPVQAPMTLLPEAMAEAVFSELEADIIGPEVRGKVRRLVSRKANEAWIAEQQRRPGGRTPADYAKFQQSIDDATEIAVKAYARLILTQPIDLRAQIAAYRANPINGA